MVVGNLLLEGAAIADEKLNAMYEEKGLTTIGKKKGLQREDADAASMLKDCFGQVLHERNCDHRKGAL